MKTGTEKTHFEARRKRETDWITFLYNRHICELSGIDQAIVVDPQQCYCYHSTGNGGCCYCYRRGRSQVSYAIFDPEI